MTSSLALSPAQQTVFDDARRMLASGNSLAVSATDGLGRTAVLRALRAATGGALIGARELVEATGRDHPMAIEEQVHELLLHALQGSDVVLVDDFHLLAAMMLGCPAYPRSGYIASVLSSVGAAADAGGKKLVLGVDGRTTATLLTRYDRVVLSELSPQDFAHVAGAYLPAGISIDFARIHRHAPKLTARQLRRTAMALGGTEPITTEAFLAHIDQTHLASNVRLGEVQEVELGDLRGMAPLLEALEAAVVFPLEDAERAAEFSLKPKRGVLLAGPPGTGKTTIGRALARRLGGKFFLLDGTMISGSRDFYDRVKHLFQLAKQNAPSIIFIDDSDVIFENSNETGLYRYLLTMLDGLESESAGRVCLMMTAMDVGNMPPALVRSGRIELWLETRLPDAEARAQILGDHVARLPASVGTVDLDALTAATDGLSGADLKRTVADGKLLFAYDQARGRPMRTITEYLLASLQTVLGNREQYAAAVARAAAMSQSRAPRAMRG